MEASVSPSLSDRIRVLSSADLRWALSAGWNDFKTKRGDLILLPFIYPLVGVLAAFFAFNSKLFPLLFPLVGGFALVGPVAAAGFYELARRREAGIDASWWHFIDPLKGRSRFPLALLTGMLAALFLSWIGTAQVIYAATLGKLAPASPAAFIEGLFGTSEGLAMIVIGNAIGAVFAIITLALAAFSFPMVVDKDTDAGNAVMTSIAVFRRNPTVIIGWGLMVASILLVGALPLFVGLLVALPVLGYATWHLYTRAVVR